MDTASLQEIYESFEYSRLSGASCEIRVLYLHPRFSLSPYGAPMMLSGTLSHTRLDGSAGYVALSYTWGDPNDTLPMLIDGRIKQITRNLANFLQQMAELFEVENLSYLPFWIDAVCIDQEHNDEKSQQVRMMAQIYSRATKAAIWLGAASEDSHLAVEFLHTSTELGNKIREFTSSEGLKTSTINFVDSWLLKIEENYDATLGPLLSLVHRPWWTRAWVQQEVALASLDDTTVICGKSQISWRAVLWAHLALLHVHYNANVNPQFQSLYGHSGSVAHRNLELGRINTRMLNMCRNSYQQLAGKAMAIEYSLTDRFVLNAVAKNGRMEASLPVDLIYSIFYISSDGTAASEAVAIDYSKPVKEIYLRAARYLYRENGLTILGLCGAGSGSTLRLPSWVPDWSNVWETESISWKTPARGTQDEAKDAKYRASGATSKYSFQIHHDKLYVTAVKVDMLISNGSSRARFQTMRDAEHLTWLSAYRDFIDDSLQGRKAHYEDALWRVPISDHSTPDQFGGLANSSMANAFRWILERIPTDESLELGPDGPKYVQYMNTYAIHRQPFVSKAGYVGLGPMAIEPDDEIFIILGHDVPLVLRDAGNGQYRLIGEPYVYGVMDGEFVNAGLKPKQLVIV